MTTKWCQDSNICIDWLGTCKSDNPKIPKNKKLVRCPKCKKRFRTFARSCSPFELCFHLYLPKHKIKAKKKKLPSKRVYLKK